MLRFASNARRWFLWVCVVGLFCAAAPLESRAEDRRDLTLKQSLLGHWQSHSKRSDYYFAENGDLTMIDDGTRNKQTYVVKSVDDAEQTVYVAV